MLDLSQTDTEPHAGSWTVPFSAVLFAMFTMQMSSLGFSPLLPAIQNAFHASYSQIGLFTGLYGVLAVVVSLPAGLLIRRVGERSVLSAGLFLVSLGLLSLSLATSFPFGLAARFVWLLGYRLSFVAVMTAVVITCPASLRGKVMGTLGAVSSFASVVGAPFGSMIARSMNWHRGIAAFGGMALLGCVQFWMLYRSPRRAGVLKDPGVSAHVDSRTGPPIYKEPVVWALTLLLGCCNAGGFSATFFMPLALKTVYGLNAVRVSYVLSAAFVFAIVANLTVGIIIDRLSRWTVMAWISGIGLCASLALNSSHVTVFCVSVALLIGTGLVAANQVFGIAGSIVAKKDTGPVMGFVSLGSGVFGYLVPQMLGVLRDRTGSFHAGWFLLSAAGAITFCSVLLLQRSAARSAAVPQERA